MKSFSLFLFSLLFLLLASFILWEFTIINAYTAKKYKLWSENYSVVFAGDSRAENLINPSLIEKKSINLGVSGGGLGTLVKFFRNKKKEKLKEMTLVISTSSITLSDRRLQRAPTLVFDDIMKFKNIPSLIKFFGADTVDVINKAFECTLHLFCPFAPARYFANGFYPLKSTGPNASTRPDFYLRMHDYKNGLSVDGVLWKQFSEKLAELAPLFKKVIVYVSPPSSKFRAALKEFKLEGEMAAFLEKLDREVSKYPNGSFYNFYRELLLGDRYFFDYVHLNEEGASLFSRYVNQRLF